jgi:catechol 2,3-dioxygenase-like lactoylglutathione lyase family enzyme
MKRAAGILLLAAVAAPGTRPLAQPALAAPTFHHLHLNSVDPERAIAFYTRQFPSTKATTFAGEPALWSPTDVLVLFAKVSSPPPTAPQSAYWHFGWHVTDVRATLATYQARPTEVKLLPLFTTDAGDSVFVSSDTWPGTGGVLGLTRAQIAEARAANVPPRGGAGFAYMAGPDAAIVEYQGNMPVERFNHVHLYQEEPACADEWYRRHLLAPAGRTRGGQEEAGDDCRRPRGEATWPALERGGMIRVPSGVVTFSDVALYSYANQNAAPLASSRGQLMDHIALRVTALDPWLTKLRSEGVRVLEGPYAVGTAREHRAALVEGPSREAIELIEIGAATAAPR